MKINVQTIQSPEGASALGDGGRDACASEMKIHGSWLNNRKSRKTYKEFEFKHGQSKPTNTSQNQSLIENDSVSYK